MSSNLFLKKKKKKKKQKTNKQTNRKTKQTNKQTTNTEMLLATLLHSDHEKVSLLSQIFRYSAFMQILVKVRVLHNVQITLYLYRFITAGPVAGAVIGVLLVIIIVIVIICFLRYGNSESDAIEYLVVLLY